MGARCARSRTARPRTYGEIARELGSSARAVGRANGRNQISIIVPCHRVIGADGSLTGYAGGLEAKRALLDHEGLAPGGYRSRPASRPNGAWRRALHRSAGNRPGLRSARSATAEDSEGTGSSYDPPFRPRALDGDRSIGTSKGIGRRAWEPEAPILRGVQAGRRDLERAAEALATRLPEPLGVLARLAYNYRWAWDPDGPDVYRASTQTAGSASPRTR